MIGRFVIVALMGSCLSGCIVQSLQRNQQAVDSSTYTIRENTCAIQEVNSKIAENSRRLNEINKVLEKAGEG